MTQTPDLELVNGPEKLGNISESERPSSEVPLPLGLRSGQGSDLNIPTHPDTSNLSHIRQQYQETVHHFWARFLLVNNKVKDCRNEDAISLFCKSFNCFISDIMPVMIIYPLKVVDIKNNKYSILATPLRRVPLKI